LRTLYPSRRHAAERPCRARLLPWPADHTGVVARNLQQGRNAPYSSSTRAGLRSSPILSSATWFPNLKGKHAISSLIGSRQGRCSSPHSRQASCRYQARSSMKGARGSFVSAKATRRRRLPARLFWRDTKTWGRFAHFTTTVREVQLEVSSCRHNQTACCRSEDRHNRPRILQATSIGICVVRKSLKMHRRWRNRAAGSGRRDGQVAALQAGLYGGRKSARSEHQQPMQDSHEASLAPACAPSGDQADGSWIPAWRRSWSKLSPPVACSHGGTAEHRLVAQRTPAKRMLAASRASLRQSPQSGHSFSAPNQRSEPPQTAAIPGKLSEP
jgi:hypothetical protein